MWTLHNAVYEELPEWWTDRLIEADEEFLKLGPDTNDPPQSRGPDSPGTSWIACRTRAFRLCWELVTQPLFIPWGTT